MKAKHLILAAALVSLSLAGYSNGSGDKKISAKDTTNYRLKVVRSNVDEVKKGDRDSAQIGLADEFEASQRVTAITIVDEEEQFARVKADEEKESPIGSRELDGAEDIQRLKVISEVVVIPPKEKQSTQGPVIDIAFVEVKPSFPGGDAALYKWLGDNMVYPAVAKAEGLSGRVIVEFIVEKDGSITNAHVLRHKHPELDAEALRLVKKMPRWQPGKNDGQPLRVKYRIPVTFKLQK